MWLPRWGSKISEATALGLLLRWVPIAKRTSSHTTREKAQDRTEGDWWDSDTLIRAKLHPHTNMCPHTQTHAHPHTFIQPSMTNTHGTRQKEPSEVISEQPNIAWKISTISCSHCDTVAHINEVIKIISKRNIWIKLMTYVWKETRRAVKCRVKYVS